MIKKTLLLAALLLLIAKLSVFGEAFDASITYNEGNMNTVTISGQSTLSGNSNVTISVFAKGKTYADITGEGEEVGDILLFAESTKTLPDGSWSVSWTPLASSECDVYVFAGALLKTEAFIAAKRGDDYEFLKTATKEQAEELFSDTLKAKAWFEGVENTENVGSAFYNLRIASDTDIEKTMAAALKMAELAEKKSVAALDGALEALAAANLSPSYAESYNALAQSDIKELMAQEADEYFDMTFEDFDEAFTRSLILCGIYKAKNYMDAVEFLKLANLVKSEKDLKKAAKAVVGKRYTEASLKVAVKSALAESSSSSGGGKSGGGVRVVTPIVTTPVTEKPLAVFSDVGESHWAYDIINTLGRQEIVSGDEKGFFCPDKGVTRAEFVKMLCTALSVKSGTKDIAFSDVFDKDWFYEYVRAAAEQGYVTGDENQCFRPNAPITREDAAVLVYRFAKLEPAKNDGTFSDYNDISEYAREAVNALFEKELINGMGNGTFLPKSGATKAQAAAMIYKVMGNGGEKA